MRVVLRVVVACVVVGGEPAIAQSSTAVCGRVVFVSCTNPQGAVGIRLTETMRTVAWRVTIPASQRHLFDRPLLVGLDDANVCVRTEQRRLGDEIILRRPDDLVIVQGPPARPHSDVAHSCDGDVAMPIVVREVAPSMTADAMRARINGRVFLRAIVDATGAVRDVHIAKGLEPSLDAASRDAFQQWVFKPARRHGEPVPIRISGEMVFTVR